MYNNSVMARGERKTEGSRAGELDPSDDLTPPTRLLQTHTHTGFSFSNLKFYDWSSFISLLETHLNIAQNFLTSHLLSSLNASPALEAMLHCSLMLGEMNWDNNDTSLVICFGNNNNDITAKDAHMLFSLWRKSPLTSHAWPILSLWFIL